MGNAQTPLRSVAPVTERSTTDVKLTLPARPENVSVIRHVLGAFAEALRLPDDLVEDLRLAVTEACTNVVLHAYDGGGSDARYELEARVEDAELVVRIRDSGVGMPSEGAARPTQNFGFGFPVMRATASSVDVVARPGGGTEIVLRFATP